MPPFFMDKEDFTETIISAIEDIKNDQFDLAINQLTYLRTKYGLSDVELFARKILHGDIAHRNWLLEAAEAYVKGKPLPVPRGKSTESL